MAGIGFELKKIYGRKTLAANVWGTIYATMTTAAPAVLSAALMLILNLLLAYAGWDVIEERFFVSFAVWVFIIATLVAVVFAAPVSRYISDCIFLEKDENICPAAFGTLVLSSVLSGIIMLVLCIGMYLSYDQLPMYFLVSYYFLGVLVTDGFSLMTFASALKHYKALTFSFIGGFILALVVYFVLGYPLGMEKIPAACIAFGVCYLVVDFALIFQIIRAFGVPRGSLFNFVAYFHRYPKLTIAGIAYTFGIYMPTIVYWSFSDMVERVNIFSTTPTYDIALFLAVFINVPALIIFVVKVETDFYEKYTKYVSALNRGTHEMIEKERTLMTRSLCYQLFFVYEIQFIITVVMVCIGTVAFPYLNANMEILSMFVILSFAIYAVFCMYLTIVVFYYFSDYKGACICACTFFGVTVICAFIACYLQDFYAFPLLIGGICGWIVTYFLLRRRMENLDSFLLC